MGNLLFSPSGRVNSEDFMRGATLLIIIGFVIGILPALSPALAVFGIVGLVLMWCWIVLWVKRYHDSGKSGWMCLLPIIVYLIAAGIVTTILQQILVDPDAAKAALEATQEAAEAGDFGALFKAAGAANALSMIDKIIIQLASAAVAYGIAMIFNNIISGQAGDNQFGPQS